MSLNPETEDNRTVMPSQISQEVTTHFGTTLQTKNLSCKATGMDVDKVSIDDSGYGPSRQSFAATGANIGHGEEGIRPFTRSVPLPPECGSNLRRYLDKTPDEFTEQRFAEVLPVIETLLKSIPNRRCPSIRLIFLGKDDADVTPYIAIFCNEKDFKRVRHKVGSPRVKTLCESGDLIMGILVIPREARLTLSPSNIKVCRNRATTLCGAPILLVNKSDNAHSDDYRKATIGGMIKITTADGESKLYGMTAGHVLDGWRNTSVDAANSSSAGTSETCSFQDLDEFKPSSSRQTEIQYQNILRGAWDFADADAFAKIDDCGANRSSNNNAQQSHDWVLFTTKSSMPNELCALKSPGCFERRELKQAACPAFHGGISEPVIMMGGSNGPKRGELSSIMSRILIGSSGTFVDAYILTPNEKGAVREGDSGSWVVHNGSPLVFGHVVATDVFGDAYVIPMVDTFDDIKRCMGAKTVELPTAKDFEVVENSNVEPVTEKLTRKTNRSGTVMGRNIWPTEFLSLRKFRNLRNERFHDFGDDEWDYSLFDRGGPDRLEIEVLQDYCRGTSREDVKNGTGPAVFRRVVWLDERNNAPEMDGSGATWPCENLLTATGLHRVLSNQRFGHEQLPDAARRLIYISDLDPACIYALATTTEAYQWKGLRNAICKYVTFQASIEVKIPTAGFLTFQLDLHIPFVILSKCPPPHASNGMIKAKPPRRWIDLSFLNFDGLESRAQDSTEVWGMQEAQVSCVINGTDDWRWVGYGFVDSEVDGILAECFEEDLVLDQIAGGELCARFPLRQPRSYWVKIFELRIASIGKQWEYNLYKLQFAIDAHFTENPTRSCLSKKVDQQPTEVKQAFDWALQAVGILRRLTDILSNTLDAWARFSSSDGDISYFEDNDGNGLPWSSSRSLHAIKQVFWKLEGVYKAFLELSKRCSEYMNALKLRLFLESKETADQNGVTSELTVSVLYPIALAACIFSMQPNAIPFEMTERSFILTVFVLIFAVYAFRLTGRVLVPRWRPIPIMLMRGLKAHLSKEEDELESQEEKRGPPLRRTLGHDIV